MNDEIPQSLKDALYTQGQIEMIERVLAALLAHEEGIIDELRHFDTSSMFLDKLSYAHRRYVIRGVEDTRDNLLSLLESLA